jgi:hypothetical protein
MEKIRLQYKDKTLEVDPRVSLEELQAWYLKFLVDAGLCEVEIVDDTGFECEEFEDDWRDVITRIKPSKFH